MEIGEKKKKRVHLIQCWAHLVKSLKSGDDGRSLQEAFEYLTKDARLTPFTKKATVFAALKEKFGVETEPTYDTDVPATQA